MNKLQIDMDMPASKLQKGFGEGVCQVLDKLCNISIQNKFRFKTPKIKEESTAMADEGEDLAEDNISGADIADMANQEQSDDDDIGDFAEPEIDGGNAEDQEDKAIIHSNISREEWLIECERVAHKLKPSKVSNDGKEWRNHLDQTKKYAGNVQGSLPDVRSKLERLSDDVTKALDRISKQESALSRSFQGMTGDYRAHSENLREITKRFESSEKNVQEMESELTDVNERLREIEEQIGTVGGQFSDNSQL